MRLIRIINDKDVLGVESSVKCFDVVRYAARGIVCRNDGKIAVFHKAKMNEYKLPGGGMDDGETPEQAFRREVLEETGCEVEHIKEIGYTEEQKQKNHFKQISYIFVAKVTKQGEPNFTEKEKGEGAEYLWLSPREARDRIKNSLSELKGSPVDQSEDLYATSFIIYRDLSILEDYIKTVENEK